jgi:PAS domain S-box-containing protein
MPRLPGIGDRIGRQLKQIGYFKRGRPDVARFCADKGYRPQYVYAWLAGRTPSYDNLKRLAQDLQVSTSWLAVGEGLERLEAQEAGSTPWQSRPSVPQIPVVRQRPGTAPPTRSRPAPALRVLDFARLREVTTKLVQLEAQLAAIFEAFPDLYVWVDGAGEIVDWKGGRTGVPDALLGPCIGKPIDQVFADDIGRRLRHAVTSAILSTTPGTVEYSTLVEGAERTFEARLMPLDTPGAPRPQVLIVVRDISERVQAERGIRESEARYRALVEGSIQGIFINKDGIIQFANQALCDLFGYAAPRTLIGQPASILCAPEERERMGRYRRDRLRGDDVPTRYQFEGVRENGARLWLEIVASTVAWDGEPAILITVQDTTARKRAQEAATALTEASRAMAALLDPNQVVEHMLETVRRLLQVRRASLYVLQPDTGILRCRAAAGASREYEMTMRDLPKGYGVLGAAVALGRPVGSPDILSEPSIPQPEWVLALNRQHGFTAVLGVPLIVRGRVFGGLVVGDVTGRSYTGEEQALLVAFADHAAVALDNARRYRELEERLASLESRQG